MLDSGYADSSITSSCPWMLLNYMNLQLANAEEEYVNGKGIVLECMYYVELRVHSVTLSILLD